MKQLNTPIPTRICREGIFVWRAGDFSDLEALGCRQSAPFYVKKDKIRKEYYNYVTFYIDISPTLLYNEYTINVGSQARWH